ncbi:response regulator [Sulfurimonas sp.]|uniref:response regulator n=1 Tax=Sulfurimonas sp. TaxID=2022749 RepID=UPI002B4A0AA9|nr:response regulator [Sulfurimonas sp.]
MKNISLYNKIFLVFVTTVMLSIGLIGWYGMKSTSDAYLDAAYRISQHSVKLLNIAIKKELERVPKDVLYKANFYALKKFLIWNSMGEDKKTKVWKQVFSDALVDFLQTQKTYFKARVIALDGQEIIKVEYNKEINRTVLFADAKLENKSSRDYVEKTKKFKKGEFYVSDMNLNIQDGVIQKPYTPVLRYATPIVNKNNKMVAIFIISFYAKNILDILEEQSTKDVENGISYFLIDKDSNYLYHKDKSKRWNRQLKNGETFFKDNFDIAKNFKNAENGSFTKNGKIYSFDKIYPLNLFSENYWYLVSSTEESVALLKLNDFKLIFMLLFVFVLFVGILIIRIFVLKITTPLTKVTAQLKALSDGEIQREHIKYDSNDEIGEIVKSTSKLVDAIETTIKQANAVADGNFTKDIKLLGKNDELGLAISRMTLRLKEITSLSQSLSLGNYDVKVIANNSEDKLGLALIDMVEYLKKITELTESIALGNIDVKYKAKSADDRLGRAILRMIKYLKTILKQANAISVEDFSSSIEIKSKNDELGTAIVKMTNMLSNSSVKNKNEIYFSEGIGDFSDKLAGISDTLELSKKAITMACRYVGAISGVLYTFDNEVKLLSLVASFAHTSESLSKKYKLGEGVVGQVGLEQKPISLTNIKDGDFDIHSGLILSKPKEVYTFPLLRDGKLFGVAQMMSFEGFNNIHKNYLSKAASIFATTIFSAAQNEKIKSLFEKSQKAFEELQTQSEELQESNVQMEQQQQQLTIQSKELKFKNDTLAEAKAEIDQRAQDLEKASKYKSEFLANMSHELRTPLNSIILLSKLLTQNQNDTLDDKDIKKSVVIHKAGNDLLLLINDILDLTKIESGKMELIYEKLQTSDLLSDMQGLFGALAKEKKLDFIINDNFNSTFLTDITKLSQVMKNLLSNAFKFTKKGIVSINIYIKDDILNVVVKDSGIGIPEDKLETIFEAFKQVDGSISREFGGTGLGLSISKNIMDILKGDISVISRLGEGSSFILSLPIKKDTQIKVKTSEKKEVLRVAEVESLSIIDNDNDEYCENEFSGKNILIVDDDSRNIFTLTSTLESMNAEVFSAFNGKEAIEILVEEEKIDMILMDIMMPIMDGLSAIKNIKADGKFKHIPIIAITAKTMPEDRNKCLDAGADDYLAKPLNHSALVSMIRAWIK